MNIPLIATGGALLFLGIFIPYFLNKRKKIEPGIESPTVNAAPLLPAHGMIIGFDEDDLMSQRASKKVSKPEEPKKSLRNKKIENRKGDKPRRRWFSKKKAQVEDIQDTFEDVPLSPLLDDDEVPVSVEQSDNASRKDARVQQHDILHENEEESVEIERKASVGLSKKDESILKESSKISSDDEENIELSKKRDILPSRLIKERMIDEQEQEQDIPISSPLKQNNNQLKTKEYKELENKEDEYIPKANTSTPRENIPSLEEVETIPLLEDDTDIPIVERNTDEKKTQIYKKPIEPEEKIIIPSTRDNGKRRVVDDDDGPTDFSGLGTLSEEERAQLRAEIDERLSEQAEEEIRLEDFPVEEGSRVSDASKSDNTRSEHPDIESLIPTYQWPTFMGDEAQALGDAERENLIVMLGNFHEDWCCQTLIFALLEEKSEGLRPLVLETLIDSYHSELLRKIYVYMAEGTDMSQEEHTLAQEALQRLGPEEVE